MWHGLDLWHAVRSNASCIRQNPTQVDAARKPLLQRLGLFRRLASDLPSRMARWLLHTSISCHLRNGYDLLIAHVLIEQRVAPRQELVIVWGMVDSLRRSHPKNGQKRRFGQIE